MGHSDPVSIFVKLINYLKTFNNSHHIESSWEKLFFRLPSTNSGYLLGKTFSNKDEIRKSLVWLFLFWRPIDCDRYHSLFHLYAQTVWYNIPSKVIQIKTVWWWHTSLPFCQLISLLTCCVTNPSHHFSLFCCRMFGHIMLFVRR